MISWAVTLFVEGCFGQWVLRNFGAGCVIVSLKARITLTRNKLGPQHSRIPHTGKTVNGMFRALSN